MNGNSWMMHHFVVADKKHSCWEEPHAVIEPYDTAHTWWEKYNIPADADRELRIFDEMKTMSVDLDTTSPDAFFASFEAAGGIYTMDRSADFKQTVETLSGFAQAA